MTKDDDAEGGRAAAALPLDIWEEFRGGAGASVKRGEITLHQLRIFWAVAHSETLTKAAKQLGLAQPSLSQQLSKLEGIAGIKLFHRRSSEMELTEAGSYLLPKAEQVLRSVQDLEEGLQPFSGGHKVTVRLAGISSMLRLLLPQAIAETQRQFPEVDFDIQDSAPNDILELLYGRRVNLGLLAANSVAQVGVGFLQVPLIDDPYVLAVPEHLSLDGITDPRTQLSAEGLDLLGRSIQFNFGTQHSKRVEQWYADILPEGRVVAQCRSFEVAIGLVRAGSGVCLTPALSSLMGSELPSGIRLYRVAVQTRHLVALVPSQYRRQQPYGTLIDELQKAATAFQLPEMRPMPPFLDRPSD